MTDIITQVEQVIIDHTSDDVSYGELAQALADAGLLAEPARTVPNRAAIAQALYINHRDAIGDNATAIDLAEKGTDAVLELLAGKPTVNEVKARALEEAAADPDFTAWLESRENKIPAARAWLHTRAQQIRDGK